MRATTRSSWTSSPSHCSRRSTQTCCCLGQTRWVAAQQQGQQDAQEAARCGTLTSLRVAFSNGTVIRIAILSLLPLQLKLIPLLPDGDGFHFEGTLEQLHQRPGSDLQCVAYFDGNEWTLQVVHAQLHTK